MKRCILFIAFSVSLSASAQWHLAIERLTEPHNSTGISSGARYFNRYDTIPCIYVVNGKEYGGFKVVYVHNGYYTDNGRTLGVFLDLNYKKVKLVEKYYFK